jgi:FMN phosphatase YigB (HAD superfamily)
MNYIFDIGNVLIEFRPALFLQKLFADPPLEKKINDIIFKGAEWVKLDEGLITQGDACGALCQKEPKYRQQIIKTMKSLPEMLTPLSETAKLLPEIKKSGHKLYYLSNYHKELSDYIFNRYPFFGLFDGGVLSCDVHMLKPSLEIYRCLLDKYGLDRRECVFIDDLEENVKAAETIGVKGVLFTDVQKVEKLLGVIQ